jgi:long-chain acyl-CoA synthetase
MWMITANPKEAEKHGMPSLGQLMQQGSPEFSSVACNPDDTAVILYTSGTTGKPKGAELSQSNMVMNAMVSRDLFQANAEDKHLVVLPLFHSFGQTVQMNCSVLTGSTLVLLPRFEPDAALKTMEEQQITLFAGVPTMYWAMLNYPDVAKQFDLPKIASNLRLGVSGGASMPVEIMKKFKETFNVPVLEGYGLSETSPVATFNRMEREPKVGSVGLPVFGIEVTVVDSQNKPVATGNEGEVVIRGHNVMKGYYRKPEETGKVLEEDGWFHTGDIGKQDEEGYLYIVDRLKDMIIRGGYNVYPREIEETLLTHPDVSMAAVIGIPHDELGEEIKAFVIPQANSKLTEKALKDWCKEKMAAYKYPRLVELRQDLPMTATGKILKRSLRDQNK